MRESQLSYIRSLLEYDPDTGVFHWLISKGRSPSGARAGTAGSQYRTIKIDSTPHLEHRLAWLLVTGKSPVGEIDHINGNGLDNRFTNLRDVTRALNQQNQRRAQSSNKTGLLGVSKADCAGFRARIFVKGREMHLGTFATPEAAHAEYLRAKRDLHPGGML